MQQGPRRCNARQVTAKGDVGAPRGVAPGDALATAFGPVFWPCDRSGGLRFFGAWHPVQANLSKCLSCRLHRLCNRVMCNTSGHRPCHRATLPVASLWPKPPAGPLPPPGRALSRRWCGQHRSLQKRRAQAGERGSRFPFPPKGAIPFSGPGSVSLQAGGRIAVSAPCQVGRTGHQGAQGHCARCAQQRDRRVGFAEGRDARHDDLPGLDRRGAFARDAGDKTLAGHRAAARPGCNGAVPGGGCDDPPPAPVVGTRTCAAACLCPCPGLTRAITRLPSLAGHAMPIPTPISGGIRDAQDPAPLHPDSETARRQYPVISR